MILLFQEVDVEYVKWYLFLGLVIAVPFSAIAALKTKLGKSELVEKVITDSLDEQVEKGHVQKEEYGERKVYYQKDLWGKLVIESGDDLKTLRSKHETTFLLLTFVVGTVILTITWPKVIYDLICDFFSGDETQ